MTPQEFKAAQFRLGLTNKEMAALLGVTVSYVEMLRSEKSGKTASKTIQRVIEQAEQLQRLQADEA